MTFLVKTTLRLILSRRCKLTFSYFVQFSVPRAEETGDPIYGNTAPNEVDDQPKPVPVSRYSEYVTSLKRDKNAGFGKQYKVHCNKTMQLLSVFCAF